MQPPFSADILGVFDRLGAKTCGSRPAPTVVIVQYGLPDFVLWGSQY